MAADTAALKADVILIPTLEQVRLVRDHRYFQADYFDLHRRFSQIRGKYPILSSIQFGFRMDRPFSPELNEAFNRMALADHLLWDGENEIFYISENLTMYSDILVGRDGFFSPSQTAQLELIADELIKPFKSFPKHPVPD